MKTAVVKQVKDLTTTFPPHSLEPSKKADMQFLASQELMAACLRYGQVLALGLSDPSKCDATGKGQQ